MPGSPAARPSLSQELQSRPASAAATASRAGRVTGNGHGKRGPDHWQVRVRGSRRGRRLSDVTIMGSRSRSLSLSLSLSLSQAPVTVTIMSLSRAANLKSKKKYIAPNLKGIRTLNLRLLIAKFHFVGLLPVSLKGNRFRPGGAVAGSGPRPGPAAARRRRSVVPASRPRRPGRPVRSGERRAPTGKSRLPYKSNPVAPAAGGSPGVDPQAPGPRPACGTGRRGAGAAGHCGTSPGPRVHERPAREEVNSRDCLPLHRRRAMIN